MRSASYDVVLVPARNSTPKQVWSGPLTAPRPRPAEDGHTQWRLGRTDEGLLQVHRGAVEEAAELLTVEVSDDGLRLTIAGVGSTLALLADDEPVLTLPLAADGDVLTVTIDAASLPDPADQPAQVVIGEPGAWLPVRRRANDLAEPGPRGAAAGPGGRRRQGAATAALVTARTAAGAGARPGGRRMKIAFIVFNIDGMGGTSRSAITQANALAPHQDVRIVSVTRSGDRPHYDIDPRIPVDYLVDVRDPKKPAALPEGLVAADAAAALHRQESALVPNRWDKQFTALCDVAMEAALPTLDVDVAVTVTPGLLVAGIDLLPDRVVVVHQEHRSSSGRSRGLEPLLNYAPRADVVAMLTPPLEDWLHDQLGAAVPPDRGDAEPAAAGVPPPLPARQPADPDGRPARAGEAVPVAGRGVRGDRRPGPRLAAADLRHRPGATRAGPRDPQVGALGPRRAARRRLRHGRRVGEGVGRGADVAHRGVPAGGAGGDGRRGAGRQLRLRRRGRARSSSTTSTGCWSVRSRWPGCRPRCSG